MSATVMASAFLIPAMHRGRGLSVDGELSKRWREGIGALQPTYREWWGYPRIRLRDFAPGDRFEGAADGSSGRGLCFSGGVDSFYSLLRGERPDYLVYVRGFDMALGDEARWQSFRSTLVDVGAELGIVPLVIETNLRENPLFDAVNWERTHGCALAAIGHLLSDRITTLTVAATLTDDFQPPWGSHPRTDHLLSSEELAIEHHGTALWRHEKLWEIQDEPLVRDNLRVCWENRAPTGNCSECDKCLVTQLALLGRGRLKRFRVFEPPRSFPDAVDALPNTTYIRTTRLLLDEPLDSAIKDALRRLLERTLPVGSSGPELRPN